MFYYDKEDLMLKGYELLSFQMEISEFLWNICTDSSRNLTQTSMFGLITGALCNRMHIFSFGWNCTKNVLFSVFSFLIFAPFICRFKLGTCWACWNIPIVTWRMPPHPRVSRTSSTGSNKTCSSYNKTFYSIRTLTLTFLTRNLFYENILKYACSHLSTWYWI